MFDFAWSEIALIGIVALVAIGPKDLPVAIKAVSQMVKKARKMAGEFQTHVDEMVREADLGGMKNSFNEIRRMDLKGTILRAVDDDGSIRRTLTEPVEFAPPPPPIPVHDTAAVEAPAPLPVVDVAARVVPGVAPAFVPPRFAPPGEKAPRLAPAFVPPAYCPPPPVEAVEPPPAEPAADTTHAAPAAPPPVSASAAAPAIDAV